MSRFELPALAARASMPAPTRAATIAQTPAALQALPSLDVAACMGSRYQVA